MINWTFSMYMHKTASCVLETEYCKKEEYLIQVLVVHDHLGKTNSEKQLIKILWW